MKILKSILLKISCCKSLDNPCSHQSWEIFEFLLNNVSIVNPNVNNKYIILKYVDHKKWNFVELLLQNVLIDPTIENNYVLKQAIDDKKINIIKLLANDIRINPFDHIGYATNNGSILILKILSDSSNTIEKFNTYSQKINKQLELNNGK
jgi:hypothetical protein